MRTIQDVMTKDCVTVTPQDPIHEAAMKMRQNDTGFIPVIEEGSRRLVGVLTDRDLTVRGYANNHPGSASVDQVMSKDIRTISPGQSVDEAAHLMADELIRRLPVVENGSLVGVVSIGDLAVRDIFADNAGDALSRISEHVH
ncbi:CBS domain-containing protein [Paenibacillus sp. P96]|uniref:CBS domain-containing protein n=1 Tax=Paenibacillus zeirhizosphaerae TaxID=2987519 RepID=A0ABT9FQ39_9BACL|nr:CBS domain-containing protein [Paenibacillus sp. P96]MDP4096840.1 CBS domain-containing protein [Paenibacillus sp. P96]